MKKNTMGMMIASKRKELGMTQLDLAEKMGVTDKAVSKWERDLSCPDVNSIPKLAEIFGMSVDELMQIKKETVSAEEKNISQRYSGADTKGRMCCDGYRCCGADCPGRTGYEDGCDHVRSRSCMRRNKSAGKEIGR